MVVSYLFLLFIIYSVMGWLMEVCDCLITKKKFVNRGFLIGPYCPIYGVGALLVIHLLKNYLDKPIGLFILSMVICSLLEYIVSYILEKIFKTSWWDYSNKRFNINGRICLETLIPFGISCLLLMYIINPFISRLLVSLPKLLINILAICIGILFIIDLVISLKIILRFKTVSQNTKKDSTETVTEYVRNEILKRKKLLDSRLINAFPSLKIINKKKNNKSN